MGTVPAAVASPGGADVAQPQKMVMAQGARGRSEGHRPPGRGQNGGVGVAGPLGVGLSPGGAGSGPFRRLPASRGGGGGEAALPDGAGCVLQYFWEVKAGRDGCANARRSHRRGCVSAGRERRELSLSPAPSFSPAPSLSPAARGDKVAPVLLSLVGATPGCRGVSGSLTTGRGHLKGMGLRVPCPVLWGRGVPGWMEKPGWGEPVAEGN